MDYKTPFSDAIEKSPIPTTSSGKVSTSKNEVPDTPGRDGGMYPEVTRDTHWPAPSHNGTVKTPFKDAV